MAISAADMNSYYTRLAKIRSTHQFTQLISPVPTFKAEQSIKSSDMATLDGWITDTDSKGGYLTRTLKLGDYSVGARIFEAQHNEIKSQLNTWEGTCYCDTYSACGCDDCGDCGDCPTDCSSDYPCSDCACDESTCDASDGN